MFMVSASFQVYEQCKRLAYYTFTITCKDVIREQNAIA